MLRYNGYLYDNEECFWEIESLISAYLSHRKKFQAWSEVSKEKAGWKEVTDCMGWCWTDIYKPSKRQCRMDETLESTDHTRSCQTISTSLMLLVHLMWMAWSRRVQAKEKATVMLRALLERCMPVVACSFQLIDELWQQIEVGHCPWNLGTSCHAKVRLLRQAFDEGGTPQDQFMQVMLGLLL